MVSIATHNRTWYEGESEDWGPIGTVIMSAIRVVGKIGRIHGSVELMESVLEPVRSIAGKVDERWLEDF